MNLCRRERVHFPETYKDFRLIRTHGRVFGIPAAVDPQAVLFRMQLFTHPAVISAATLADIQEQIDRFDSKSITPQPLGNYAGFDLVQLGSELLAVPKNAPEGDLHLPEERRRLGVLTGSTRTELEAAIERTRSASAVEFAGWLPVYELAGNCGQHPQFKHTGEPPAGYRFTCSAPAEARAYGLGERLSLSLQNAWCAAIGGANAVLRILAAFLRPRAGVTLRARVNVFFALIRLVFSLLIRGCSPVAILKFLQTRNLQSQLLIGDHREPVLLTSMPFTFGQSPWVIEIEDPTTLFFPHIQNGNTAHLDYATTPVFPIVKTLLEADSCKAILTHMQSTAKLVATLFDSDIITRKIVHSPLGVKLPAKHQRHDPAGDDEPIELLFINSWCQVPENFYVRGGLDVLEAFDILRIRYPQLRLTLRTDLPGLADHFHRIIEAGNVRIINRFVTAEEMADLHESSHIFLLPAARVHIVSLLQAMSYGLAVVGSDGWGMQEYLEDDRNGLVVEGRHGVASWPDEEAGVLRENYQTMHTADPVVVEGIVEAVSRLVEDRALRRRLGRAARQDVQDRFNLDQWNRGLQRALDMARPAADPSGKSEKKCVPVHEFVSAGARKTA